METVRTRKDLLLIQQHHWGLAIGFDYVTEDDDDGHSVRDNRYRLITQQNSVLLSRRNVWWCCVQGVSIHFDCVLGYNQWL
jgi:hypothetical protein